MAGSILRYILLGGLAEDTGCRADPAFSSSLKYKTNIVILGYLSLGF